MEIEIEPAGDAIQVTARGSRGERPKPWSLGASVTPERLATFTRNVGRAVRAGKPLAPETLGEAQALHAAVFQAPLLELAAQLREASRNAPLLQRLFVHDPALQAVPWEALCEPESSVGFWGSSEKVLLARGVASSSPWEPREVRGAVRLLVVAPSSDESALRSVKAALETSIEAGEIEWLDPIAGLKAGKRHFFDELRRGKTPHVIHFLGHGGVEEKHPVLRLADDEDGEPVWIKAEALAQELSASFRGDLRLIVLEACEGAKPGAFGSAAELLSRAGADAVVAHLWPVKADVARACSRDFYRTLTGAKRDLGDGVASLGAARRTLLLESAAGFSPVVYLRGAGSAIFRFEDRRVSPPKAKSAAPSARSKPLAPALQSLLARPFCMVLGDRGEDTSTLRAELEAFLAENGDTGCAGLSLFSLTQRCALRFGQEMLQSLFQQALVGALQRATPASLLVDALAKRLRPGVHVTLLWLPSLESAIARHHPDRTLYVLQPSSSGPSALPRIVKRAAGASAWRVSPSLPQRFDLSAEIVVLRIYGGYSPEPMPILTSPLLTEDDHIRGLVSVEPSRTPEWANKLVGELRMRPGLFLDLSVLEWRHRMLLRWLYGNAPAPTDSLALLDPQADPIEQEIWTSGGGLPGTGRIAALREERGDLAAQIEALSSEEAAS
ncbi:CHAT domain-containing protein [Sorangium cellulosum]|nr:CHAT domain-containing protein [Sorangium cellulosum]